MTRDEVTRSGIPDLTPEREAEIRRLFDGGAETAGQLDDAGRELIAALDKLRAILHDVSHHSNAYMEMPGDLGDRVDANERNDACPEPYCANKRARAAASVAAKEPG